MRRHTFERKSGRRIVDLEIVPFSSSVVVGILFRVFGGWQRLDDDGLFRDRERLYDRLLRDGQRLDDGRRWRMR